MTTKDKIVLSSDNVEQFLRENFYNTKFVSTMSDSEKNRIAREATSMWNMDEEKAQALANHIPIDPAEVLRLLVNPLLGREYISSGWNLADMEKAFGTDWRERFEADYEQKTHLIG